MSEERRYMILSVDIEVVGRLFQGLLDIGDVFLPGDARVVAVHNEWERRALGFIIWSTSYDIVPEGHMIPHLPPLPIRLRSWRREPPQ